MSDFDSDFSEEYAEHLARVRRLKARAAREASALDSVVDDNSLPDVHGGEASAPESSVEMRAPTPTRPIHDGMISESEVPAGTEIFEHPDDALAAAEALAGENGTKAHDNHASFARARLIALLADTSVKDNSLVAAAKQLLRDFAPRRSVTASGERTVFLMPAKDEGGPAPFGRVFFVRATHSPACHDPHDVHDSAPAADIDDEY